MREHLGATRTRDDGEGHAAGAAPSPSVHAGRRAESHEAWAQLVFENSPIAQYVTDADGRILRFNAAAAALWGREPALGEERWCGSYRLLHRDGRPMARETCPMAQAIREARSIHGGEAMAERPDGTRVAFLAYPTPLMDGEGALVGAANVLVDISQHRQAQDQQTLLMNELNHRVKNTLASVQSLAAHSFRGGDDLRSMRRAFEGRLMALSQAHNHLADENWRGAELRVLAQQALAAHFEQGRELRLEGGSVRLPPRMAAPLGLALNELSMNAGRHGAFSGEGGAVSVGWTTAPDASLVTIVWRETGGPPVQAPAARGFGLRFVEDVAARELGGRAAFEFAPDGLRCEIEIPLAPD